MVTTHTEHTKPRKYNFLRIGNLARNFFVDNIQIYMHILGPENYTFLGRSCHYILTQL